MPRRDYKTCKGCGRHVSVCGPLSHERYCFPCGRVVYEENLRQFVQQAASEEMDPELKERLASLRTPLL